MVQRRRMKAGARSALTKLSGPLSWRYGRDLTDAARRGQLDPVIGRDEELTRLIQILGRKTKNNPVLIGKSGVGKTAIVEGLALRIADGAVPPGLQGKRVVSLDLASMLAGARIRGEFEERLKSALALLAVSKGEFLLLIDELHGNWPGCKRGRRRSRTGGGPSERPSPRSSRSRRTWRPSGPRPPGSSGPAISSGPPPSGTGRSVSLSGAWMPPPRR